MILIDAAGLKASRPNRPLFDDVSLTLSDGSGVMGFVTAEQRVWARTSMRKD